MLTSMRRGRYPAWVLEGTALAGCATHIELQNVDVSGTAAAVTPSTILADGISTAAVTLTVRHANVATDAGAYLFANVIMYTAASQILNASDLLNPSITAQVQRVVAAAPASP